MFTTCKVKRVTPLGQKGPNHFHPFNWPSGLLRCGLWNVQLFAAVCLTDNALNLLWVNVSLSGKSGVIGKFFHSVHRLNWPSGLLRCDLWNFQLCAAVCLTDDSSNLLWVDVTLLGKSGVMGTFFDSITALRNTLTTGVSVSSSPSGISGLSLFSTRHYFQSWLIAQPSPPGSIPI